MAEIDALNAVEVKSDNLTVPDMSIIKSINEVDIPPWEDQTQSLTDFFGDNENHIFSLQKIKKWPEILRFKPFELWR